MATILIVVASVAAFLVADIAAFDILKLMSCSIIAMQAAYLLSWLIGGANPVVSAWALIRHYVIDVAMRRTPAATPQSKDAAMNGGQPLNSADKLDQA